jgi:hypothetical protein
VEIVQITRPEDSYKALEEMSSYIQGLLETLELPYRKLLLCGGDMGFTSAMTYDMEVFSAAQQRWLGLFPYNRTMAISALLFVLGVIANIVPFFLFGWGEERITSGLAAILNSTTPLFTAGLAAAFVPDERRSQRRPDSDLAGDGDGTRRGGGRRDRAQVRALGRDRAGARAVEGPAGSPRGG